MRINRTLPSAAPRAGSSSTPSPIPELERIDARLASLAVDSEYTLDRAEATGASDERPAREGVRLRAPSRITIDGKSVIAGRRFWKSFFHAAQVDDGVFRLFGAEEVFARLAERDAKRSLRFTIEHHPGGTSRAVGVAKRSSASLEPHSALALLRGHGAERIEYHEGVLTSQHVPADGPGKFRVGPDDFENRFRLELPLDGYGEPRLYVALLRLICQNGAVGVQRAFRSSVRLGDDPWHSLDRAIGSYANADGFAAMRRRFESAQRSWASLEEVGSLERVLHAISWGGSADAAARRRVDFERLVGDLPGIYGVASISAISPKRRRLLPSRTRVFELVNFATEIATHHAGPAAANRIHAWMASMVVDEFDLEGSADHVSDFEALHLATTTTPGSASGRGKRRLA